MELKDRIIQEALALFLTKGVKSMTMSDVANELGISKRTLYEVFRDKEELLGQCFNAHSIKMKEEVAMLIAQSDNVIDTLMRMYAKHLHKAKTVHPSVIRDLKKYHSNIYTQMKCQHAAEMEAFIPLFRKGVEQGFIREDVNIEIILWLVKSQFKAVVEDEYTLTDKYSTDEFVRAIILNFARGISTSLGNEKIDKIVENLRKEVI